MIKKVWPGWYSVNIPVHRSSYADREAWCKSNIGFSDKDTWVFVEAGGSPGHFSFKDEKWAMMFLLRWS